jgi:fibronectin type 3 domain-containing protein
MSRIALAAWTAALVLASLLAAPAGAQLSETQVSGADAEPGVRIAVRGDSAFVYHTARLPLGYGVRVERSVQGEAFQPIADSLLFPAPSTLAFRSAIGEARFQQIRRSIRATRDAQAYFLLRSDRAMGTFLTFAYPDVARALGRLAVDPSAPIGREATYRVIVVNDLGIPRGDTLQASSPLVVRDAPAPTDLSAENTEGRISLSWTYPETDRDSDDQVLRFDVVRRGEDGNPVRLNDDILLRNAAATDHGASFTLPARGQTEVLTVRAVQITGRVIESEPIEIVVEDRVPPPPPTNVEAVVATNEVVEVNWPVSTAPDAAGYNVYRALSLSEEFRKLNRRQLGLLETVYADSTARGRSTYFYKVAVVDSAGNESILSNPEMTNVLDSTPPAMPADLRARVLDTKQLDVAWTAPGGIPRDLKTYEVFFRRSDVGESWTRIDAGNLRDTAYVSPESEALRFRDGAPYTVGIVAVDSSLNRSDSLFAEVRVPDLVAPAPPEQVQALNDQGVRALVRWSRSMDGDVTGYRVYRRVVPSPADTAFADSAWTRTPQGQLSVPDDAVEVGQTVRYAVSAVDSLGNESERSTPVEFVMRDRAAPPAVRNVQAKKQDEGVLVVWEASPARDVAGYRLMRSDLPTGPFEVVGPVPLQDTRFVDPAGTAGTYYRVYALDTSENVSRASRPAVARE